MEAPTIEKIFDYEVNCINSENNLQPAIERSKYWNTQANYWLTKSKDCKIPSTIDLAKSYEMRRYYHITSASLFHNKGLGKLTNMHLKLAQESENKHERILRTKLNFF